MFSFLNPGFLIALLAAGIPVVIHLFAKKRPQKIIFSSVRFIKEIQKKQNKKINIKNLLILLMRILFILFAVLGISRPAFKVPFLKSSEKHPPTAIAFILDNSYSMNYLVDDKTEFEKGLETLSKISDLLNEEDKVILLTADKTWNEINGFPVSGKIPNKMLASVKTCFNPLSFDELLKTANQKLSDTQYANAEIILISDYQKQKITYNPDFKTYWVATSDIEERNNLKINSVKTAIQIVNSELKHSINFEVANLSEFDEENILAKLFMNGRTIAEKAIKIDKNQVRGEKFPVEISETGYYSGFVEVKNERWRDDNRFYFQFYFNKNPGIALFSENKNLPDQLNVALEILSGSGHFEIYDDLTDLNYAKLSKFDNIIFYNPPELNQKMRFLFDKLLANNRKISVILSKNISNEWKLLYQNIFDMKFSGFETVDQRRIVPDKFRKYKDIIGDKNIRNIKVTDYWKIITQSESVLGTSSEPLVVEKNGNYLIVMDPESQRNEFYVSPVYPVLMHLIIKDTGYRGIDASFKTGERIIYSKAEITDPDGENFVSGENGFRAEFPGIYQVRTESKSYPVAVNIGEDDSYYERFDSPEELPPSVFAADTNWEDNILRARYGFELSKYFFILAFICVLIELMLIKSEERKQDKA
ncbi:MAG: hypothetical protein CSB55_02635 [Candidatus Cloacimonadota bacterium]|nr:MAG: hypothetical protein CSB55_02635 [Candidatus Cloacimonadota bacterium]